VRPGLEILEGRTLPSGIVYPYVESLNRTTPAGPTTNATSVSYTATFSSAVTGVNASDFATVLTGTVTDQSIQVATVNPAVYTVTVSGIHGPGTLGLNLVDNNSIRNSAGNGLVEPNAPASFQSQLTFSTGGVNSSPSSEAVADLNGDGKPDLVVTNSNPNGTVSVLLGNGDGTFQSPTAFTTGSYPWSVAIADVNGDGKPDLVVANKGSNNVSVLLGNGNGTFQQQKTFAAGSAPYSVAVANLGNGEPDLVVANNGGNSVSVLLGNGNGTFQNQTTFATGSHPHAVAVVDVNGDGKPDLVVANAGSPPPGVVGKSVSVLLGNGNGTFQNQTTFGTGYAPYSVAVADLNGDGKPDLVVANNFSNTVSVLLANGNGTFQNQTNFPTGMYPHSVAVADLNGDGKPDLVVTNAIGPVNSYGNASVLLGNGDGTFQNQTTFATGGEPRSVVVADLIGDGKPDLVVSNYASGTASVLLNTDGNFTGQVYTIFDLPANHFVVTAGTLPSYSGVPTAYPPAQSPAAAASFASTGTPIVFTVAAEDLFGNVDYNYHGTVGFVSSDTAATLPGNSTLTSGVGIFSATLGSAGSQFITVSDVSTPSITGATGAIVSRGLVVTSFTPTPTGFVVTFNKPFNPSSVIMYSEGSTPDDIMLATTGTQVSIRGSVLLNSPNAPTSITFVKTNLASAVGTFNPGSGLLSAGNYTVTLRSFSAGNGFEDSLGEPLDGKDQANPGVNYVFTFSVSAPPTAVGIPDFARGPSNTDLVFLPTSIGNGNTFNLVYTNPTTSPSTGTATVTFSTIAATLQANIQAALNALPQIGTNGVGAPNAPVVVQNSAISTQGANVLVTFQNSYFVTATSQVLSSTTPGVSIALATINAPNNVTGNGIPVALSNGQNVTSGSFTLQYNPSLLNISGAVSKIAGASFTVNANNATGTAVISFSSPSKISSTTASLTLGSLLATVPFSATASYGAKQLLHFSSEQLNTTASSNIAVTNQDAVEVAAFFGDVNDTGLPFASSGAVGAISTVAGLVPSTVIQTLPGFTLFPDLDPVVIGGVSQSGQAGIIGNDNTTMNKQLTSGQPSIPWLPAGLAVSAAATTHFTVSAPTAATAGGGFAFTVSALDQFNNSTPGYSGTVHFTSSDQSASTSLPANATLTAGAGVFSATLTTVGIQTLSASDSVSSNITGASSPVSVNAPTASHFTVSAPTAATAGGVFLFTVTALDQLNHTAAGYSGTVVFSSSNAGASTSLPGPATLTSGVGTFSATLTTAGTQTLTATDSASSNIAGASSPITLSAAATTHFMVSVPYATRPAYGFRMIVTAQDQFNNTAPTYTGTVHFTSSDSDTGVVLPANGTLSSGSGSFSATLQTGGQQTLVAMDTISAATTGSAIIAVDVEAATQFIVAAPSTITAGVPFLLTVTAEDQWGVTSVTTGAYNGTVHFSSSDPRQVAAGGALPANTTLTAGIGYFTALLETAGNQTITASDLFTSSIAGTTTTIFVSAAPATHFAVTAAPLPSYPGVPGAYPSPAPASAFASTGAPLVFSVTAEDQFGNPAPTYTGTVGFTSSDLAATLPGNSTLTNGVGIFSATLRSAGNQFITATDVSTPSITGATAAIATRGLVVTSFTPTPTGFVVTFDSSFNPNSVIMYSAGSTPNDIMLATTGTQVSIRGSVLLNSPAAPTSITFVKTDVASAVGTFNPGSGLLSAGNYTVTLRSFNAGTGNGFADFLGGALDGKDQGNPGVNYVFTFSVSAPPTAVGIPDFARGPSNTDALFLPSSIGNGNTFNLIYTNPNTSPTTGTATVVFSTIAATLQANIQAALNALPQIGTNGVGAPNAPVVVQNSAISTQGANVLVTFQNSYFVTATSQVLSSTTPGVSITLATINAPNNVTGNGIPVALSNGQNVTSGSFTLQYNPTLLNITGAVSKIAGASFTVNANNATGTAVISFSSPSKISSTTASLTLGSLLATVPFSATASYGAKQLLHFSSEQLNGTAGPITVTNQDAVEVAAFFGDVNDTGLPFASSGAVGAISTVAGLVPSTVFQTLPGFTLFPDLDPVISGGVSQSGQAGIIGNDNTTMNKELTAGQPSIPFLPAGLAVNTIGPDPTLSVPTDLAASPGATVIVPVNIDTARPEGSTGMVEAVLALTYDPKVFEVSAADVQLGTVPEGGSGWKLQAEVNTQRGLIGVELYSSTAIQSSVGGSLVTIAMHVRGMAPAGTTGLTLVPYVDPAGGVEVYETSLLGAEGEFILHPAQTPAGTEPGAPGQVTIDSRPLAASNGAIGIENQLDLMPAAVLPSSAPPGNEFSAIVEQVFGDLAQTGANRLLPTAYGFVQPAAILTSEPNDQSPTGVQGLALLQGPAALSQPDWLSDAYVDGLEALFAREVYEEGRSRIP